MAEIIKDQFCVIGLGEFGFSLAKSLAEKGAYVLAVDHDIEKVEEIKRYVSETVQFDATDPVLLREHGVFDADVVIVAIGESFEPVVLITMELLKEGVKKVISRASNPTQEMILKKIGINEIIHPERDEGQRKAISLLSTSISDFFKLSNEVGIFEIEAPNDMVGFKLKDLKIRQRYKLTIITIKRKKPRDESLKEEGNGNKSHEHYEVLGVLSADTKIRETDRLIMMGNQEAIDKLLDIN